MTSVRNPSGQSTASIGIILPHAYRGGTFRLFRSICRYFAKFPELNVVSAVPATGSQIETLSEWVKEQEFNNLQACEFSFETYNENEAKEILKKSGIVAKQFISDSYYLPKDSSGLLMDCTHWFFVSDRIMEVLLPLKPYGIFVTDHLHRYYPYIFHENAYAAQEYCIWNFQRNIRNADLCVASTDGTVEDVVSFSGATGKIIKVPIGMDVEHFLQLINKCGEGQDGCSFTFPYFIWVTNSSHHKNHENALLALKKFFGQNARLHIVVVGCNTDLFSPNIEANLCDSRRAAASDAYISRIRNMIAEEFEEYSDRIHFEGEVTDERYVQLLRDAEFLWHNVIADNGTYSIIEAACLGVPSVSSNYPQVKEICDLLQLNVRYFDPYDVQLTAQALLEGPDPSVIDRQCTIKRVCTTGHEEWTDELKKSLIEIDSPRKCLEYL